MKIKEIWIQYINYIGQLLLLIDHIKELVILLPFIKIRKNGNYPQYYAFNNSSVSKTDISEISGKVLYLLFYEKKNLINI